MNNRILLVAAVAGLAIIIGIVGIFRPLYVRIVISWKFSWIQLGTDSSLMMSQDNWALNPNGFVNMDHTGVNGNI